MILFNSLGWTRNEIVRLRMNRLENVTVLDQHGNEVDFQVTSRMFMVKLLKAP